ncbi:MAG: beta-lactamase family protein [Planctomycetes bacterium]|nr:beta-lactamase family protein [Planctomycetota bacterium]
MFTRHATLPSIVLLAMLAATSVSAAQVKDKEKPADLRELLEELRKEYNLPAMVGAVVKGDQIIAEGAAGIRELGKKKNNPVTLDDRFMINLCTRRVTSVMICRVIDSGKLSFDTKIGEALPNFKIRDEYRNVTMDLLLAGKAAMGPYRDVDPSTTPELFEKKGSIADRRARFLQYVLVDKPIARPGDEYFSNAGFFVAAEITARRTGRTWENLVQAEIFKPLGMTKSGFGRPRTQGRPNEPVMYFKKDADYEAAPLEMPAELIMAAPANVHCSIRDLAKFAAHELAAARGYDKLLKEDTAKRYQELPPGPRKDEVASIGKSKWSVAGYVYWPSKNMAAAVASNAGDSEEACRKFLATVKKRYTDAGK